MINKAYHNILMKRLASFSDEKETYEWKLFSHQSKAGPKASFVGKERKQDRERNRKLTQQKIIKKWNEAANSLLYLIINIYYILLCIYTIEAIFQLTIFLFFAFTERKKLPCQRATWKTISWNKKKAWITALRPEPSV